MPNRRRETSVGRVSIQQLQASVRVPELDQYQTDPDPDPGPDPDHQYHDQRCFLLSPRESGDANWERKRSGRTAAPLNLRKLHPNAAQVRRGCCETKDKEPDHERVEPAGPSMCFHSVNVVMRTLPLQESKCIICTAQQLILSEKQLDCRAGFVAVWFVWEKRRSEFTLV